MAETYNDTERILKAINAGDKKAETVLIHRYMDFCTQYLMEKRGIEKTEALSVFYEGITLFFHKLVTGGFVYRDEQGLRKYLVSLCYKKSYEYERMMKGPELAMSTDEEADFRHLQSQVYREKADQYGIELEKAKAPKDVETLSTLAREVFLSLKDKCKLLLMMRVVVKLSYQEIMESVGLFYQIKNEAVCRNMVKRCKKNWQQQIMTETDHDGNL